MLEKQRKDLASEYAATEDAEAKAILESKIVELTAEMDAKELTMSTLTKQVASAGVIVFKQLDMDGDGKLRCALYPAPFLICFLCVSSFALLDQCCSAGRSQAHCAVV